MLIYVCTQEREGWLDDVCRDWGVILKKVPGICGLESLLLRGGNFSPCTHLVVDAAAVKEQGSELHSVLESFFALYHVPIICWHSDLDGTEESDESLIADYTTPLIDRQWDKPTIHHVLLPNQESAFAAWHAVECAFAEKYTKYPELVLTIAKEIRQLADVQETNDVEPEAGDTTTLPGKGAFTVVVAGLGDRVGTTTTALTLTRILAQQHEAACMVELPPSKGHIQGLASSVGVETLRPGVIQPSKWEYWIFAEDASFPTFEEPVQARVLDCGSVKQTEGTIHWEAMPQGDLRLLCCGGALWDIDRVVTLMRKNKIPVDVQLLVTLAAESDQDLIVTMLRIAGYDGEIHFVQYQSSYKGLENDVLYEQILERNNNHEGTMD